MSSECQICKKQLNGHPKIDVEGTLCCFGCAKKRVLAIAEEKRRLCDEPFLQKQDEYRRALALRSQIQDEFETQLAAYKQGIGDAHGSTLLPLTLLIVSCLLPFFGVVKGVLAWSVIIACGVFFLISELVARRRMAEYMRSTPLPQQPDILSEALPTPPPSFPDYEHVSHFLLPPDGSYYLWANYRGATLRRDAFTCQCCQKEFERGALDVHHILPQKMRSLDDPTNLVTLCRECHKRETSLSHFSISTGRIWPI